MTRDEIRRTSSNMYVAGSSRRSEEAFMHFKKLLAAGHLQDAAPGQISAALSAITADRRTEFNQYAFDQSSSAGFNRLDSGIQRLLAPYAIDHAVAIGERSKVEPLLRYIAQPDLIALMLSTRT